MKAPGTKHNVSFYRKLHLTKWWCCKGGREIHRAMCAALHCTVFWQSCRVDYQISGLIWYEDEANAATKRPGYCDSCQNYGHSSTKEMLDLSRAVRFKSLVLVVARRSTNLRFKKRIHVCNGVGESASLEQEFHISSFHLSDSTA